MDSALISSAEYGDISEFQNMTSETKRELLRQALVRLAEREGNRKRQKDIVKFFGIDDFGKPLTSTLTDAKSALSRLAELSVALSGARDGDLLVGIRKVNKNAVLQVKGTIFPSRLVLDELRCHSDLWSQFLNKLKQVEYFKAQGGKVEDWLEVEEDSIPTATLCDSGASLKVLQPGDMARNIDPERLNTMIHSDFLDEDQFESFFPIKGSQKGLRGKHTLVLFRKYWKIASRCTFRSEFEGRILSLYDSTDPAFLVLPNIASGYAKKTKHGVKRIGIQEHMDRHLPINRWVRVTTSAIGVQVRHGEERIIVDPVIKMKMKGLTPAAFKSFIQKLIRFRPLVVEFPDHLPGPKIIQAEKVLYSLVILLSQEAGSFVPDIQRYVTGAESASKRTGVSITEDAYLDPKRLCNVFVAALIAQRVNGWSLPLHALESIGESAVKAMETSSYWEWNAKRGSTLSPRLLENDQPPEHRISALLDELKAFQSDLHFVRDISYGAKVKKGFEDRPLSMAMEHCVDQHWAPNLAYFFPPEILDCVGLESGSKTFRPLFSAIWDESSGLNPRKNSFNDEEFRENEFVQELREAQRLYLVAKQSTPSVRPKVPGQYVIEVDLPTGWLSCLVGSLEIGGKIVTLSSDNPMELIVIRKPSRNGPNATPLTQQEKTIVEKKARIILTKGVKLNAAKPPVEGLRGAKAFLTERGYTIGQGKAGLLWEEFRQGITLSFDLIRHAPYDNLQNGLTTFATGVSRNAEKDLEILVRHTQSTVLRRALGYIAGFSSTIEMNRIGRDGSGIIRAVVSEDVGAFQFLLGVSVLFPSALRPVKKCPCKFSVPSPPLLWHVRAKLHELLFDKCPDKCLWTPIADTSRTPTKHQLDALGLIKENSLMGKPGSFLWMTVGSGKTMAVLMYVKWLIGRGSMPPYFVYTLPKSALVSVITEIKKFNLKIRLLVPLKTAKRKDFPQDIEVAIGKSPSVAPYVVNMITTDSHLRMCDDILTPIAPRALVVFDEVHKNLNDTQRTTVALNLASSAADFIAFTGTPVVDAKAYKLIAWLQRIVPFEVNLKNYLVAANAMISKQVPTGVRTEHHNVTVDLSAANLEAYHDLVPPSLGGRNKNAVLSDFQEATRLCYAIVTDEMVNLAVRLQRSRGRRVCIVAKDSRHQQNLVEKILEEGYQRTQIFVLEKSASAYLSADDTSSLYLFAVVPVSRPEGYTLTLMNSMVTSVYPSNLATRTQLEGRINRIGQTSDMVEYFTLHAGILTSILKSHREARSLMKALEEIAKSAHC